MTIQSDTSYQGGASLSGGPPRALEEPATPATPATPAVPAAAPQSGEPEQPFARRVWRGLPEDPSWVRPAFLGLLVVTVRALATGYRALLVRHPWVSPLSGTFLNIGPHSMAFSLRVQQVVRTTGLPPYGQMGALSAVFQFVYGFGTIEGHFVQRCAAAGMTQDEYFRQAMSSISEQPQFAVNLQSAADLMEARGGDTVEEMRERDFTFAPETLIAGIETMVARGEDR